jgi:citrate lyase subunit beta/citryl-CoA lyase
MSVRVRSLLFTPGNVSKMLLKGSSSQAHVQIVDLEDSVPASQKETARVTARQFLETAKQNSLLCVRVNNTRRLLEGDLDACVVAGVWGVSVGKV